MILLLAVVGGTTGVGVALSSEIDVPVDYGYDGVRRLDSLDQLPSSVETIDVWPIFITSPESMNKFSNSSNLKPSQKILRSICVEDESFHVQRESVVFLFRYRHLRVCQRVLRKV